MSAPLQRVKTARAAVWLVRAALAFWVALIFFYRPGLCRVPGAAFMDMVNGTAPRPYVTRALFPAVIRLAVAATPAALREAVADSAAATRLRATWFVGRELGWRREDFYPQLVGFLLTVLCLAGFSATIERLWRHFYRPAQPQGALLSLAALLGLPPFFKYTNYLYDFPTLLLYSLALLLMARRVWGWYLIVLALACLCKETAVLLIGVFALGGAARPARAADGCSAVTADGGSWRARTVPRFREWDGRRLGLLAAQVSIWAGARAWLWRLFRANPGRTLEFHLFNHNLRELCAPYTAADALAWLWIAALVLHGFGRQPRLLRAGVGMLLPLAGLCLFFGYVDELRDYYEVYAPALLLGACTFWRVLGRPIETVSDA